MVINNSNVYIAFYSDLVTDAGVGTDVTATICTTRPDINFTYLGGGEASNQSLTITVLGAATIASIGLWTAASGGDMLTYEHLPMSVSVVPGTWTIDAGDIKVKFT